MKSHSDKQGQLELRTCEERKARSRTLSRAFMKSHSRRPGVKRAMIATRRKCKCGAPAEPMHICPYSYDINNDNKTKCNCCYECLCACAESI